MNEQTLSTITITQVAIIVQDIEAKARAWAEVLGLPVPEILDYIPERAVSAAR